MKKGVSFCDLPKQRIRKIKKDEVIPRLPSLLSMLILLQGANFINYRMSGTRKEYIPYGSSNERLQP